MNVQPEQPIANGRRFVIIIGLIGVTSSLIAWFVEPRQFYISYLAAILLWLGISLGSLAWLMIHMLAAGKWGYPLRRIFEAAARLLPLMLVLFIPIFFGVHRLYPWADPARVAVSDVLQHKRAYLNLPAFIIRTVVAFLIWIVLATLLTNWSAKQDVTRSPEPLVKARKLSGPGLVVYPLTGTLVFVDWIMSLEPSWYSTMFPVLICIGQMLSSVVFSIMLLAWLAPRTSLGEVTNREVFQDLGSLLLAFTMMWAYLAFSQLLIIWLGNLPHEISWYLHRIAGGWRWIAGFIIAFHFLVPFFLLLSRRAKRSVMALMLIAAVLFLAHILDVWWMVVPSFYTQGFHLSWVDLATFLGVGGVWGVGFTLLLERRPLLPLNDPRFAVASI